ncbi:MAG: FHA domain-containing protein [Chloroflexota bacterium]
MMSNHLRFALKLLSLILLTLSLPLQAQEENRLRITQVDTTAFPAVRLTLLATDGKSWPLPGPTGFSLVENGKPINDFDLTTVPVGVEVVFVVDANSDIGRRDDPAGGKTRLEKVKDSINLYATTFMSRSQQDRVQIIVPDQTLGDCPGCLIQEKDREFYTSAINAMTGYNPTSFGDTPLQEMLTAALDYAGRSHAEGRFQAILLFTDGATLDEQLDFASLTAAAQKNEVVIFGAILGSRADAEEIANVKLLTEPTHGDWLHAPEAEAATPFYEAWQGNANQSQITYRSQANQSGAQAVEVSLGAAVAKTNYEMTIEVPTVRLTLDNSQPIRRVAPAGDTPLVAIEPTSQPVVAQVEWPDGHPRQLTAATLLVNGQEQPVTDPPILDASGLLSFEWNVSNLDEGVYQLEVRVADELGLVAQSEPLPLVIEVVRPEPPATEPPAAPATPVSTEETANDGGPGLDLGLLGVAAGIAAVVFAFIIVIVAFVIVRRRRTAATPSPTPAAQPVAGAVAHDATQVMLPAFAVNAHLEAMENAPEHQGPIGIGGPIMKVGRDPNLAQIVFSDKSVSRLHARISESNGTYWLYDEGSASGTYLNYQRLPMTPQALKDGDEIHFGRVHVRFRLAMPAPVRPTVAADKDATQVMASPDRPAGPPPAPVEPDDLSTRPWQQQQPSPPAPQDPAVRRPADLDDAPTDYFNPHAPKK